MALPLKSPTSTHIGLASDGLLLSGLLWTINPHFVGLRWTSAALGPILIATNQSQLTGWMFDYADSEYGLFSNLCLSGQLRQTQ